MTTLSIPLTPELAQFVEKTIKETGQTRAEVVRQALKLYAEEQAVRKVLLAQAEPTLAGDLDTLAAQID
jgi:metal-responsive CopG/Arc/MetJ family transcriptional regulator